MKKQKKPKAPTYCVPIRCVETGERWKTKTEAAQAIGVSLNVISDRIRFREPINGKHYEHVNPINYKAYGN
jgi:uncharacterized protein (DUF736 family)